MNTASYFSPPLSRTRLAWGLTALLVTSVPFFNDVPIWILGLLLATATWRYLAFIQRRRPIRAIFRFLWTMANFAMVWVSYGTVNGLEAGTALLLVMAAMKLTETTRSRDLVVLVYMSFFLIVAHALFDQSLFAAAYAVFALLVAVAALVQIGRRNEPAAPRVATLAAGSLLVQALPVLLVMFVLFPRVPGPFWSLPSRHIATAGLKDSMEPGSISNLLQSSDVAFRVEFADESPPSSQLYWRGPVFATVKGRSWSPLHRSSRPTKVAVSGPRFDYTITLEAHRQRWLFGLDAPLPTRLPPFSELSENLQLVSDSPIGERRSYRLRSHTSYLLEADGLGARHAVYLDTKNVVNPKTRELALFWRRESRSDAEVIRRALRYFNRENFFYTLKPPLLTIRGASDDFLFSTRRGFCEHYSSSFALLMRYAGIPSRVVTGYQGGEKNPLSGHYTVRQSDAHAWNEVWLDGVGWKRIDPTAAVAPERVEHGIGAALRDGESLPSLILGSGILMSKLRHTWDAINATWNAHILGYGQRSQLDFLRNLGFKAPSAAKLVVLLSLSMIVILLGLSVLLAARNEKRRDPVALLYRQFCRKLARRKVRRLPCEGPLDYARRAARQLPKLAAQIDDITRRYVSERYGPAPSNTGRLRLRQKIRRFGRALS